MPDRNELYVLILLLSVMAILTSCHNSSKVASSPKVKEDKNAIVESAPFLEERIDSSSFNALFFTAKADVTTKQESGSTSFNINLRARKDSIIWISISPLLGIEVARAVITRDSVKFVDRINKKYLLTDIEFLNKMFDINMDFDIVQGIITGNLFAYKKNKFNSVYTEEGLFILSTLSKRKLKRSLEDIDPSKPIVQDVWVNDGNYRIHKLSVEDQKLNKTMVVNYSDFQNTGSGLFPFQSNTVVTAGKSMTVDISYKKVNITGELEFPFSIPSSYENIH